MMPHDWIESFALFCREALPFALTLLIRITLPLLGGLFMLWLLRDHAPAARRFVADATLMSVAGVVLLSVILASRTVMWQSPLSGGTDRTSVAAPIPPAASAETTPPLPPAPPALPEAPVPPTAPRISSNEPRLYPTDGPMDINASTFAENNERIDRSLPPSAEGEAAVIESDTPSLPTLPEAPVAPATPLPTVSTPVVHETAPGLSMAVIGLGATVSALLLGWLALAWGMLQWVRRGARTVQDVETLWQLYELSAKAGVRPPLLLESEHVNGPFLTGLWRPAIVLPAEWRTELEPQALRAVLVHELTHLANRDCGWALLSRVLCAVCWPNPLLWLLCRLREEASEETCDRVVLAGGCQAQSYARCLLTLAERLNGFSPERTAATGAIAGRSALARRIERILSGSTLSALEPSTLTRILVPTLAVVATLASLFVVSPAASQTPVPAAPPAASADLQNAQDEALPAPQKAEQAQQEAKEAQREAQRDAAQSQHEAQREALKETEQAQRETQKETEQAQREAEQEMKSAIAAAKDAQRQAGAMQRVTGMTTPKQEIDEAFKEAAKQLKAALAEVERTRTRFKADTLPLDGKRSEIDGLHRQIERLKRSLSKKILLKLEGLKDLPAQMKPEMDRLRAELPVRMRRSGISDQTMQEMRRQFNLLKRPDGPLGSKLWQEKISKRVQQAIRQAQRDRL